MSGREGGKEEEREGREGGKEKEREGREGVFFCVFCYLNIR